MIAAWMGYVIAVSALFSVAAIVGERAARDAGRPMRPLWMLALSLMLAAGVISALRSGSADDTAAAVPATSADGVSEFSSNPDAFSFPGNVGIPSTVAVNPTLSRLDRPLLWLWGAGSLLWGALLVASAARIQRVKAASRLDVVNDTRVYVSENIGPAVCGLFRPHIVLPSWVLALPEIDREMILTHEREHARARDSLTLACAAIGVLFVPWNPFVWLVFARLRFAIEADCDARVLTLIDDVRGYGSLLLTVGERALRDPSPVPALVESPAHLERRLLLMTRRRPANGMLRTLFAAVFGLVLVAAACELPRPRSTTDTVSTIGSAQENFIQYRWVDEGSSTDGAVVTYTAPNSSERIALGDTVVLDITGIDSAWVSPEADAPGEFMVSLILNASGAAKMRASTAERVGRRLAVVIDDRVVTVATVNSALGRVIPVGGFAMEEAYSLARRINREARGR